MAQGPIAAAMEDYDVVDSSAEEVGDDCDEPVAPTHWESSEKWRHISMRSDETSFPGQRLKFLKDTEGVKQADTAVNEMLSLLKACRESFASPPVRLDTEHLAAMVWGKSKRNAVSSDFVSHVLQHAQEHLTLILRRAEGEKSRMPLRYRALHSVKLNTAFFTKWMYTFYQCSLHAGGTGAYFSELRDKKSNLAGTHAPGSPAAVIEETILSRMAVESEIKVRGAKGVSEDQFRGFLACLDSLPGAATDTMAPHLVDTFASFSRNFGSLARAAQLRMLAIDDAKTLSMAKVGANASLIQRTGNSRKFITTVHVLASVNTGLLVAATPSRIHVSLSESMEVLFSSLCGGQEPRPGEFNDYELAFDRGYSGELTARASTLGFTVYSTVRALRGGPFKYENVVETKMGSNGITLLIASGGPTGAYWVRIAPKPGRPEMYIVAFRSGKGGKSDVGIVCTTNLRTLPAHWVYTTKHPLAKVVTVNSFNIEDEGEVGNEAMGVARAFLDEIMQLTEQQGGREWFIMRRFCFTSTSAPRALRLAWAERAHWEEDDVSDLSSVLDALGYHPRIPGEAAESPLVVDSPARPGSSTAMTQPLSLAEDNDDSSSSSGEEGDGFELELQGSQLSVVCRLASLLTMDVDRILERIQTSAVDNSRSSKRTRLSGASAAVSQALRVIPEGELDPCPVEDLPVGMKDACSVALTQPNPSRRTAFLKSHLMEAGTSTAGRLGALDDDKMWIAALVQAELLPARHPDNGWTSDELPSCWKGALDELSRRREAAAREKQARAARLLSALEKERDKEAAVEAAKECSDNFERAKSANERAKAAKSQLQKAKVSDSSPAMQKVVEALECTKEARQTIRKGKARALRLCRKAANGNLGNPSRRLAGETAKEADTAEAAATEAEEAARSAPVQDGAARSAMNGKRELTPLENVWDAWLMKRIPGTQAMRLGTRNESRLLSQLSGALRDEGWVIVGLCTIGLVCRKGKRHLACSPDAVAVCWRSGTGEAMAAVVELKTLSNTEEQRGGGREEGVFSSVTVAAGETNELFKKRVPHSDHRIQLIHHAVACSLSDVLYVRGTIDNILTVTHVSFEHNVLVQYECILDSVHSEFFPWMTTSPRSHLPLEALEKLRMDGVHLALDLETATCLFESWKALHELSAKEPSGTLPAAKHIMPCTVARYDVCKHPIDTSDFLRALFNLCMHLTQHQELFVQLFERVATNFHYLQRLVYMEKDLVKYRDLRGKMKEELRKDSPDMETVEKLREELPFRTMKELRRAMDKHKNHLTFARRMHCEVSDLVHGIKYEAMNHSGHTPSSTEGSARSRVPVLDDRLQRGQMRRDLLVLDANEELAGPRTAVDDESQQKLLELITKLKTAKRATKNAFSVFNKRDSLHSRARRAKGPKLHSVTPATKGSHICVYCKESLARSARDACDTCRVPLCRKPFGVRTDGTSTSSCWDLWHSQVYMQMPDAVPQPRRTDKHASE